MLQPIVNLFDQLEQNGVEYCNWKSNDKLEQSLRGETDIELLCHRTQVSEVEAALAECGYKKFPDVSYTAFPGITNHMGFDEQSGEIIHVHLHYELTFGTPYLKEYVSPWGPYVLENRKRDEETGVWITDPNVELVLLFVRYAMKIRRLNIRARQSRFQSFLKEHDWLVNRTDIDTVETVARDLLNEEVSRQIIRMIENYPSIGQFHTLRKLIKPELRPYRTHRTGATLLLPYLRKGFRGVGKLNEAVLGRPFPTRRTPASGGIEVAFVGVDGSGKSTHVTEITDWLSWKVDVHQVYFGSGDGNSSLLRYPLKKLNQLRGRLQGGNQPQNTTEDNTEINAQSRESPTDSPSSSRVGAAKAIWALTLAREKRNKRRQSKRARNHGMIVIMDRYPQNQVAGHNDGPLLQGWKKRNSRILRWLSEWEKDIYNQLHETPPDLIIKLQTSPETAKQRKPETPLRELRQKAETVEQLEYEDDNCNTVVVDTEQDLDQVVRTIKTEIWKIL